MTKKDRRVTLRRTLEQARHCVQEALSVVEHGEDVRCAADDVDAAVALLTGKVHDELRELVADQTLAAKREHRSSDEEDERGERT